MRTVAPGVLSVLQPAAAHQDPAMQIHGGSAWLQRLSAAESADTLGQVMFSRWW